MFINFWYWAAKSDELGETPLQRRMLGQDFVLFRDSQGAAHCLSDVCVHRGGSLSHGKRKGDCVECPYHGWQFNGDGVCTRIPSMGPDAKIPARAKVDSYPTIERYGLVFAFLGDLPEAERPPIMDIPEFGREGWRETYQVFEWDFDYKRSIENGIDSAHNEFVHTTHIAQNLADEHYIVPDIDLLDTEWGTGFYSRMPAQPLTEERMRKESGRDKEAEITVGTGHHGPSCLWTYIRPSETMKIHQYLLETPVDTGRTRLVLINMRNFMPTEEMDEPVNERNRFVALQDRDVLLGVRPKITPRTNTREVFVPADKPIARYREFVKEWEGRGWRIDTDEVECNEGKVAYAIPSPARRESKGWVLDAVPLLPAAQVRAQAAE